MSGQKTISIITPSYNQAEFIERTLESVQAQQVDVPVEHLVIDGGSTDGTLDILRKYDGKIRFVSEPDHSMQDALNKGFGMASGDIVGWLNSDDICLPGALQKVSAFFDQNPGCLWLYGNCRMVDENDREIRRWITAYKNRLSEKYSYNRLLTENFISQPAVYIRRNALQAAGPIDMGLPTAMDYDLWLRLARLGNPGYIAEDLACFRVHGQSISAKNYRKQFEEQYQIHLRYDRNPWRLFKHRVKIRLIVFAYWLLSAMKTVSGENR